jgi:hypothetical protein
MAKKKQPKPAAPRMGRPKVYDDRATLSNIGIERQLLAALDRHAKRQGLTRSQAIAAAVRLWLEGK